MEFHAGNVSNGNQAEQLHMTHILDGSSYREYQQWKSSRAAAHDSLPGWEFMQGISAMEIKQSSCTYDMTHSLDGSSCRECQQ